MSHDPQLAGPVQSLVKVPGVTRSATRIALAGLGAVALAIALLSAPIPGFPSSLFLLLALVFFARSSPPLEAWVREHRVLGRWVERVEARQRLSPVLRVAAVALFWSGLLISWLLFREMDVPGLEALLLGTALLVAAVLLFFR